MSHPILVTIGCLGVLASVTSPAAAEGPGAEGAPAATVVPDTERRREVRRKQTLLNLAGGIVGVSVGSTAVAYLGRDSDYGRPAAYLTTGLGGAVLGAGAGMFIAKAAGASSPKAFRNAGMLGSLIGAFGGTMLGYSLAEPTGMRRPAVAGAGVAAAIAGVTMLVLTFWDGPPPARPAEL